METSFRPHLFGVVAGLFLAVALVLASTIFVRAWLKISEAQTISVTGSARKTVRSDLVVWRGSVLTEAATLLAAQQALKADVLKAEGFLRANAVTNYLISPISIEEVRAREKSDREDTPLKTVRFRLSQTLEVQSPEIERVKQLDRECVALVEQGVLFTTGQIKYLYTKAGEAKVEMLAEATKDARARADQIAMQGGRRIEQLKSARMGVFQITPLYSVETSWDGKNDTTSLEKTVTAVVSACFSMK